MAVLLEKEMMAVYRVLFAEDELLVRLGLQNAIPWEKFDMELVAQAENGEEAYELFQKIRPDVVITDIRMDKMDGYELIQKIRKLDSECAILVISCLDDFNTVRKMLPYHIIGYILKASMSMEEIFDMLEKARVHLKEVGRSGIEAQQQLCPRRKQIGRYLTSADSHLPDGANSLKWLRQERMIQMQIFSLEEEEWEKINELAMKFIYNLVERQLPEAVLAELNQRCFCLLMEKKAEDLEERIRKVLHSVDSFLGVHYHVFHGERLGRESLREWYQRLLSQKKRGDKHRDIQESQWDCIIRTAVRYMRDHHQETISLTDIAVIINMSPSYFSYLFKKETGKNYVEFLNEIRLEEVLHELRTSDCKIAAVAENHGFRNLEYFSRYFKKSIGVSPAKWRKENR